MLIPTEIYGEVRGLFVNGSLDVSLETTPVPRARATWEGFDGDDHGGLTRGSCIRVIRQYSPKGTEIRNARQLSMISEEELAKVANAMGIDHIQPEWLGANIVFSGIPDFTQVPPSSRLIFEGGASVVVDIENGPCKFPAQIIEEHHPGKGLDFPKHARGLRGVVGWVEKPGIIEKGEKARLHIPPQRIYAHAAVN